MSWLRTIRTALKQARCDHACYLEDMRDLRPALGEGAGVICDCGLCGKELWAPYGLALDCRWMPKPTEDTVPVPHKP